ncbi:hypothetical protein [Tenacibaculum discolor]|uniref:hypothetical protein n=1 Tax=Tenacibaculum discolor TaxID=361581 RepID=UPI000F5907C6|nr:hypothetical protein [Tenacibaculum discolor]
MPKAQNVLKIIIVVIFMNSCSSYKEAADNMNAEYEVLSSVLKESSGNIYYKTIIEEGNIPIDSYVKDKYLEFYLCGKDVDSPVKIPKEEVAFLKQKVKSVSVQRIDKLFPSLKEKTTKKKERLVTSFISMPILFRNNTMAIYYSTQTYGGEFKLLQKVNGEWETICANSVWIE